MIHQNVTSVRFQETTVLIKGESGSGKSSLALDLIYQGGTLISDDLTFFEVQNNELYALPNLKNKGLIEVRDIGVIRLPKVVETPTKVDLIIELVKNTQNDRLMCAKEFFIGGIKIPCFSLKEFDFALTNKVITAIKILKNEIEFLQQPKGENE